MEAAAAGEAGVRQARVSTAGRGIDRLSDAGVRKFVARARVGDKLFDGLGLFIQKTRTAGSWRVKFRFGADHVERLFAIGLYPAMSLSEARERRNTARALVAAGIDPVQRRRTERAERMQACVDTFEALAEEWFATQRRDWTPSHAAKAHAAFRRDVYPVLGPIAVADVKPTHVAAVVKRILNRGALETARKTRQHIDAVFVHAVASGYRLDNPADAAKGLLRTRRTVKARPALLDIADLRRVLAAVEASDASEAVKVCSTLVAYASVRLGNAIAAKWQDFDLDGGTWRIARGEMKQRDEARDDFVVYLGPTILATLRRWHTRTGGKARGYMFPSPSKSGEHITHESLEKLYRKTLGLRDTMTPHGWRAAMSSNARDAGFSADAVELQLDHQHAGGDAIVLAYDRGRREVERRSLTAWWDATLSGMPTDPNVLPFRAVVA